MIIRDYFNKLLWDSKSNKIRKEIDIIYINRGVPGNQIRINYNEIIKIYPDKFKYFDSISEIYKIIPYHRIKKILNTKTEEIIYKKKTLDNDNAYKSV